MPALHRGVFERGETMHSSLCLAGSLPATSKITPTRGVLSSGQPEARVFALSQTLRGSRVETQVKAEIARFRKRGRPYGGGCGATSEAETPSCAKNKN